MHCGHFSQFHNDLKNSVKSVSDNFEPSSGKVKKDILLYGDSSLDDNKKRSFLEATLIFINDLFPNKIILRNIHIQ